MINNNINRHYEEDGIKISDYGHSKYLHFNKEMSLFIESKHQYLTHELELKQEIIAGIQYTTLKKKIIMPTHIIIAQN